mmetsp:Transcript_11480/g.30159  ORF Transcript_11480/g.30159 Transcript_11480/m.30159 type:complete len:429 (+) Transcript_11480:77-1363(+)
MADVGGLECAAGKWLQRLQCDSRLPPKSTLEVLRRRESSARSQAEALADAERRCASLTTERLEDERRLSVRRAQALADAQEELRAERTRRLEAEVALSRAQEEVRLGEERLSSEVALRNTAEVAQRNAMRGVAQLKAIVADDQSLRIIDDFREKFEAQRARISALQRQLEVVREGSAATGASLCRTHKEFDVARRQWGGERELLIRSRDQAGTQLTKLREAGVALQVAAETALHMCSRVADASASKISAASVDPVVDGYSEASPEATPAVSSAPVLARPDCFVHQDSARVDAVSMGHDDVDDRTGLEQALGLPEFASLVSLVSAEEQAVATQAAELELTLWLAAVAQVEPQALGSAEGQAEASGMALHAAAEQVFAALEPFLRPSAAAHASASAAPATALAAGGAALASWFAAEGAAFGGQGAGVAAA